MPNTLRIKRGLAAGLPNGTVAEPLFTIDTYDLYIGKGDGTNQRFQKYIASGATTQILRGDGSLYSFPLNISSPTNGQVLKYNGTAWVNDSDVAGITGTGASGQVAYWNGTNTQTGSNNLFWDAANNRLGINNASPSQSLDIIGNAFIKGSGNTSGTTALTVQNSDGTNAFRVRNDGVIKIGLSSDSPYIAGFSNTTIGGASTRTLGFIYDASSAVRPAPAFYFSSTNTIDYTSSTGGFIYLTTTFSPTSGTGIYNHFLLNPTINQTGGANGITRGLYVNPTLTAAADWRSIEWSNNTGWGLYGAGTANNYMAGGLTIGTTNIGTSNLRISKAITGAAALGSVVQNGTIQSDVTNIAAGYTNQLNTAASAFTLAGYYHFQASQVSIGAGSSVTTQAGFFAESSLTGATNNYGFYGNIASGTGRWNLYMSGTANNYMAGSLGIGSTGILGYTNLAIQKSITGNAAAFGVWVGSQVQSAVTTRAEYYGTQASTQDATFTLSSLFHYRADQGTFGASSTVTTQIGFGVTSSLIGATNNYGFRGLIPSGTGRWNLYMDGTAANHLNGNTIIGGTTDAGFKLDVVGTGRFSGQILSSITSASALKIQQSSWFELSANDIISGTGSSIIAGSTPGMGIRFGTSITFGTGTIGFHYITSNYALFSTQTSGVNLSTGVPSSAVLEARSTTRGFLPPRMTTTQRNAIATPAAGLLVYQTTDNALSVYNGTSWLDLNTTTSLQSSYTPTFTNVLNMTSTTGATTTYYIRVGNVIYVNGTINVNATSANTDTKFAISLPVASNFANQSELTGSLTKYNNISGIILADTVNDRAEVTFYPTTGNTSGTYTFSFSYIVI